MTWTLISNTAAGSSDQSNVVTTGISTLTADLIIVFGASYNPGGAFTFSDNQSNSWTAFTGTASNGGAIAWMWYKQSPTVNASHTFQIAGTSIFPSLTVMAWKGSVASPSDGTPTGAGGGANITSLQPGSFTPSQAGDLFVSCVTNATANTPSINLSFTPLNAQSFLSSTHWGFYDAYFINTGTSALNPTWSWSTNDSNNSTVLAAFKVAASGGAGKLIPEFPLIGVGGMIGWRATLPLVAAWRVGKTLKDNPILSRRRLLLRRR